MATRVSKATDTYSPDYPEKRDYKSVRLFQLNRVLLAGIKILGNCPYPRCLVRVDQVGELGTQRDQNRHEKLERVDTHI
jgi:hypothetical protein